MTTAADFSRDQLEQILAYGARIFLRHDVDFDPGCAVQMAELEADHRVSATYFFMTAGPYNLFQPATVEAVRRIYSLGHDIGLHVDLNLPRDAATPDWVLERATARDYGLTSIGYHRLFGRKVSFHAPPRSVLWRGLRGWEHAMSRNWEGLYVADSRGVWREDPIRFIEERLGRGERPQANLHPCWWWWPASVADYQRAIEKDKP